MFTPRKGEMVQEAIEGYLGNANIMSVQSINKHIWRLRNGSVSNRRRW
jgi:hypothetical protein